MTVRDTKHKARVLQQQAERIVMDEDLIERYRLEAAAAMKTEAEKRVAEVSNPEEDEVLRNTSLHEIEDLVPALLARLGPVRAALDGHGGGIKVTKKENKQLSQFTINKRGQPYQVLVPTDKKYERLGIELYKRPDGKTRWNTSQPTQDRVNYLQELLEYEKNFIV